MPTQRGAKAIPTKLAVAGKPFRLPAVAIQRYGAELSVCAGPIKDQEGKNSIGYINLRTRSTAAAKRVQRVLHAKLRRHRPIWSVEAVHAWLANTIVPLVRDQLVPVRNANN